MILKILLIALALYSILFGVLCPTKAEVISPTITETPRIDLISSKEHRFEAVVLEILEEKNQKLFGTTQLYQKLRIRSISDYLRGKDIIVENGGLQSSIIRRYEPEDTIVVSEISQQNNAKYYLILDYVRRDALYTLFIIFLLITIVIARKKGITSFLGMVYSFFIIFKFILPQITQGANPTLIALIGGLLTVPVTFYLSHGFNKKTHVAIVSTLIVLVITGAIASFFIQGAHLTGYSTEDASFLELTSHGKINVQGLLLAGVIIGLLGILDDITVSQAAIIFKLKETSPHLGFKDLYQKGSDIGKDHIGSLINTLILVYTGAALPFLLLFTSNEQSFTSAINYEVIAEEIVRTLSGSIGLVLAVPITTLLASWVIARHT